MNELKGMTCQKCPEPPHFFNDVLRNFAKSSSRYSFVRILSISSSKIMKWSSRYSGVHFVDLVVNLIFQKWSEVLSFYDSYVKSSSLYSPVHILSTTFPDRFAPESVFSRGFTRSLSLALLNYFVMMWLT